MKNLILLLILTLPLPARAVTGSANLSNTAILGLPSNNTTAPSGLTIPIPSLLDGTWYYVFASGSLTSGYYPFYKNGVLYSVATGHKGNCFFQGKAQSGSDNFSIVTSTVTFNNGGSLTSGTWSGGGSGNGGFVSGSTAQTYGDLQGPYVLDGTAATVFPGFQNNSAANDSFSVRGWCQTI